MRNKTILKSALFAKEGEIFSSVMLPHTYNNLDGQDGGNDYYRGIGTYIIELPNPSEGKRQYIEIEGANHIATLYVNGKLLGSHEGGFSTFRFDLTNYMKKEGNALTVVASNAPSDIYPQAADFTFFGGLYRDISFLEVEEAHFDLLKDGSLGVFVTPYNTGKTRIDLFPVNHQGCKVRVEIIDHDGNIVAFDECNAEAHTVIKLDVKSPHLWNGIEDPYCYTLKSKLVKDDRLVDEVDIEYGYRSFHVDPQNGFFLNGKSMPLRGVSRHQDRQDKGWAISEEDQDEDIALIKEIGANTIRLSHYQHSQYFYNKCDKTGFIIWAEIPFISVFNSSKAAYKNTMDQMRELIAQNYNHPSIFFWGISNEITIGGESEALFRNLSSLNALCKSMDPIRLTTMAEVSMTPKNSEHVYITDVLGYNHYFGWYVGDVEDNASWLDDFHSINPDRALSLSEYGAEAVLKWHSAYPENHDYTEEYASYYHHEMLKIIEKRPYLWATYVWNMFDFAADSRDEGGVKGRNNKGLVTYDRKIKKDAFYLYKAYWSNEPMVYVAGSRFIDRAPGERNFTVYTNCPTVTLAVNGEHFLTKDVVDRAAVFENVELMDGENVISAYSGSVWGNEFIVNAVEKHNYSYDLIATGDSGNWFENLENISPRRKLEIKEGYYSIKDKISELLDNPKTAEHIYPLLGTIEQNNSFAIDIGKANNPMGEFMKMMRLDDILKMMGSLFSPNIRDDINRKLQQIKK